MAHIIAYFCQAGSPAINAGDKALLANMTGANDTGAAILGALANAGGMAVIFR